MVTMQFHSDPSSGVHTTIEVFVHEDKICIMIDSEIYSGNVITLDRRTAIKFSREIRKQISMIKEV